MEAALRGVSSVHPLRSRRYRGLVTNDAIDQELNCRRSAPMRAGVLVLTAAAACATIAATALATPTTPSPELLHQRLVTTPIGDSALPSGFSGATAGNL